MIYLMQINILGTNYDVFTASPAEDSKLETGDGYIDTTIKRLVVDDMKNQETDPDNKTDLAYYQRQVLRHEIVHAFMFESGLEASCDWASNEEAVDWIAIQIPKMAGIMEQGGLL